MYTHLFWMYTTNRHVKWSVEYFFPQMQPNYNSFWLADELWAPGPCDYHSVWLCLISQTQQRLHTPTSRNTHTLQNICFLPFNFWRKPQDNVTLRSWHNITKVNLTPDLACSSVAMVPSISLLGPGRGEDSSGMTASMATTQHQEPWEQIPRTDLDLHSEPEA